jgi:hypothetical protein
MALKLADRIFAALLLLTGVYITVAAWRYGLYRDSVPGPGFFPFGAGTALTLLSAAILVRSFRDATTLGGRVAGSILLSVLGLIVAMSAFTLVAPVLGISLSAFAAMVWIGWVSEEHHKRNRAFLIRLALTSAAVTLVCHLIFSTLIGIPLIRGPLGF